MNDHVTAAERMDPPTDPYEARIFAAGFWIGITAGGMAGLGMVILALWLRG